MVTSVERARELYSNGYWHDSGAAFATCAAEIDDRQSGGATVALADGETLAQYGRTLKKLGQYADSERAFARAIRLYEDLGAGQRADICFVLNECAQLYTLLAQYQASDAMLERALAIEEANLPAGSYLYASTLLRQSENSMLRGDAQVALDLCTKSLECIDKTFGPGSIESCEALELYGFYQMNLGFLSEAQRTLSKCLEIAESKLGKEHAELASYLVGYAEILVACSKFPEAEHALDRARAISEQRIGKLSQPYMQSLNSMAVNLATQGRIIEAIPLMEQALDAARKLFGPDHCMLANIYNNLAVFNKLLGRDKAFEEANEQAKALLRMTLAKTDENNLHSLISLADKLSMSEEFEAAHEALERAQAVADKQHGAHSLKSGTVIFARAAVCAAQLDWQNASDLCVQYIAILESIKGKDDLDLTQPLRLLASCQLELGQKAECEALFERAHAIEKKQGVPDASVAAVKMELESRQSKFGEDHPSVTEGLRYYGLALTASGESAQAKGVLTDYIMRRADEYTPDTTSFLQDVLSNVIMLLVNRLDKELAGELMIKIKDALVTRSFKFDLPAHFMLFQAEFYSGDITAAMATARKAADLSHSPQYLKTARLLREMLTKSMQQLEDRGDITNARDMQTIIDSLDD